jgi:hypothetical protein
MKTLVRTVLLFTLLAGALSLGMRPAWACSCVPVNARQTLAEADGAFVGELVARKDSMGFPMGGSDTSVFTFRVTESFKGDLGELVDVESSSYGASCGLEVTQGDRVGLFLTNEQNRWTSNLCHQVELRVLQRAAKSLGTGDAAAPPDGAPKDTAPASDARPQGSAVWPWLLIAAVAALTPIAFFGLRALRGSTR